MLISASLFAWLKALNSQDCIILSEPSLPVLLRTELVQTDSGNKTRPGDRVHVYVDGVAPPG